MSSHDHDNDPRPQGPQTQAEGSSGGSSGYGGEPPIVASGMMPEDEPGETPAQRLGQRLRRARLARNLTQGAVAKDLFSASYLRAVERGQIRPSLGALEKLAERLGASVTDLLGIRSEASPEEPSAADQEPSAPSEPGAEQPDEENE